MCGCGCDVDVFTEWRVCSLYTPDSSPTSSLIHLILYIKTGAHTTMRVSLYIKIGCLHHYLGVPRTVYQARAHPALRPWMLPALRLGWFSACSDIPLLPYPVGSHSPLSLRGRPRGARGRIRVAPSCSPPAQGCPLAHRGASTPSPHRSGLLCAGDVGMLQRTLGGDALAGLLLQHGQHQIEPHGAAIIKFST